MLELLKELCKTHPLTEEHLTVYNFFSDWMGRSRCITLEQLQSDVALEVIPFYDVPLKYWEVYDVDKRQAINYSYITRFGVYALKCFNGVVGDEIYHFSRIQSPFYQVKYDVGGYPNPSEAYTISYGDLPTEYKWKVGAKQFTQRNAISTGYYQLPEDFRRDLVSYSNKYNIITYSRKVYGTRVVVSSLTKIPLSFNALL